jgi:Fe-S-cluster containining protein
MSTQEAAKILTTQPRHLTDRMNWTWHGDGFVSLLGQPCPFLSATNDCAIYDIRPYNCRRFMCLRAKDEPFEHGPDGCLNLTDRLAQSRDARMQYRDNQRRAQRWAVDMGWKNS